MSFLDPQKLLSFFGEGRTLNSKPEITTLFGSFDTFYFKGFFSL